MFVTASTPVWLIIAAVVIFVALSVIAFIKSGDIAEGSGLILVSAFIALMIALLGSAAFPETQTYDNPYDQPKGIPSPIGSSIQKEEVNKFIEEAIDVENVSIRLNTERNSSQIVEDAKNGEIFDFVAVDDGVKTDGSFFFTEDSMEIIINTESEIKEQISVPTN